MTETRHFGLHPFRLVGSIQPLLNSDGGIAEYVHRLPATVRPNRYANGPFCRFTLPGAPSAAGVYVLTVGSEPRYVGECEDLAVRFGPTGYGAIVARNCHSDGQATNCKVNSLVLLTAKSAELVNVWFLQTDERKTIETDLIELLRPPWNKSRGAGGGDPSMTKPHAFAPTADDLRSALMTELSAAVAAGERAIRIRAGDLHRKISDYTGRNNRMPVCCHVMRAAMRPGDTVVASPPKGAGPNLIVEYLLPRA